MKKPECIYCGSIYLRKVDITDGNVNVVCCTCDEVYPSFWQKTHFSIKHMIKKMIKKIIVVLVILVLLPQNALALNTYTTDLELSSSQYFSIAHASQAGLSLATDFSLEAYIKLEQLPSVAGETMMIVSKHKEGNQTTTGYRMYLTSTNRLYVQYTNSAGDTSQTLVYMTYSEFYDWTADWSRVSVACDISVPSCQWYIDGVATTTTIQLSLATNVQQNTEAFQVGATTESGGGAGKFTDGLVDDVRVWNDIRTAQEISDNYNCSLAGSENNLQGYWRFDNNGDGSTANSNDLTNNNVATFQSASRPFTATCGATAASSFSSSIINL